MSIFDPVPANNAMETENDFEEVKNNNNYYNED